MKNLIFVVMVLSFQNANASSFKADFFSTNEWISDEPCDLSKLQTFDKSKLRDVIKHFKNADHSTLMSVADYALMNGDLGVDATIAIPAKISQSFHKLQSCLTPGKEEYSVVMANDGFPNIIADISGHRIAVGVNAVAGLEKLTLTDAERDSLYTFILAHEFSHFMLETAIRDAESKLSPAGNRSFVLMWKDVMRDPANSSIYMKEYDIQHNEVDALAAVFMEKCGFESPPLNVLIAGTTLQDVTESDATHCESTRLRALSIRKVVEQGSPAKALTQY